MKKQNLFLSLILFSGFTAGLISCNDNKPDPNRTEADIFGSVALFNEFTDPLPDSGMTVSILGSIPLNSTKTDIDGKYVFKNLPFGTYNLLFQKEGYGDFIKVVDHLNNTDGVTGVELLLLGQKSNTKVPILQVIPVTINVTIKVTVDSIGTPERPRYYRIFYSTENDVSNIAFQFQSGRLTATSAVDETFLSVGDIHAMGFITGDIVFVKAYGESFYPNDYFDPLLGRVVFPNENLISANDKSFEVQ